MSKKVIVRFNEYSIQENSAPLNRLCGFMLGTSMIDVIDEFLNEKYSSEMDLLESNPRNPKRSKVTEAIVQSLESNTQLFPLMSKGILVSAHSCRSLERNRFEITFTNPKVHGILDGGHNTLAIALYFLEKAGAMESELKKIKRWSDLPSTWNTFSPLLEDVKPLLNFLVPVEILYAKENAVDDNEFIDSIMYIAEARNNNTQLTEETKANKKGYYEPLKQFVDPSLKEKIEWRSNEGGSIKVRELLALSLIPLSVTEFGSRINESQIYSSKAECAKVFEELITNDKVSKPVSNDFSIEVTHRETLSALRMIGILPKLYDLIYQNLPDAYNENDGKFGRITSVTMGDDDKPAGKTKFYGNAVKYSYPDGFIVPLVYSMRELIGKDSNEELYWITDPMAFVTTYLSEVVRTYGEMVIKMANYDPQKVGKNRGSYQVACLAVRDVVRRNIH
jgi:hypothetical protein